MLCSNVHSKIWTIWIKFIIDYNGNKSIEENKIEMKACLPTKWFLLEKAIVVKGLISFSIVYDQWLENALKKMILFLSCLLNVCQQFPVLFFKILFSVGI
jgi:hypothetical protein